MNLSRRSFLGTAAAAAAGSAVASAASSWSSPAFAASPPGDVVGKISVGYQGWFACVGDGAPINAWWHWSNNWSQPPSVSNNVIKAWPDMREYLNWYQTAYPGLNDGDTASLFSSYDQSTVNAHFRWMQQNGCDTAALQRFNPNTSEGPTRDAMAVRVRAAAEAYGRKFYIMYDVTGWTNMATEIMTDWTTKMSAHTASPAYAMQNGKPVVCIWGFGFNDSNHPWDAPTCLSVINWFKSQGVYLIGGVPREWRTGTGGSRAGYLGVYHAFNMLSPWMVGAIATAADSDNAYTTYTVPDQADCNANGVDYQPCVLPGDVSAQTQRANGDFMWRQFYNVVRAGVQGIYISMFDEYGEGNQIAKTAESANGVPSGSGLWALDEGGTPCSADYYLRLTKDGGSMLKGQIALTATRPTQPMIVGASTGMVFSLRAMANGMIVTADNAGASPLIANRTAIGTWEQFDMLEAANDFIGLRAHANGMIVTADNAGASPLIANRTALQLWETFQLIHNSNGTISLRSMVNNMIVTADNAGASPLIANRTAIGTWEQFILIAGN
jgi:hypothetical protein